jgi:hypothetical protein
VCGPCNTGWGIFDNIERLEKRVAFLKVHDKKMKRIALIKSVHLYYQEGIVLRFAK